MPLVVEFPNASTALMENYAAQGMMIPGMPVALPGDILPPYFLWADRSLVLFSAWPELEKSYNAGLLKVLTHDSPALEQTNNPACWVEVADGTGLLLPDIGNLFARPWRPDQTTRLAGSKETDAIRNITGSFVGFSYRTYGAYGAFYIGASVGNDSNGTGGSADNYTVFDASRVVPTATENRPVNYAQPIAIFMGRAKL